MAVILSGNAVVRKRQLSQFAQSALFPTVNWVERISGPARQRDGA